MFLRIAARAVFWMIVTPIAVVLRLMGRDPLDRGLESAAVSYWSPYPNSARRDFTSER